MLDQADDKAIRSDEEGEEKLNDLILITSNIEKMLIECPHQKNDIRQLFLQSESIIKLLQAYAKSSPYICQLFSKERTRLAALRSNQTLKEILTNQQQPTIIDDYIDRKQALKLLEQDMKELQQLFLELQQLVNAPIINQASDEPRTWFTTWFVQQMQTTAHYQIGDAVTWLRDLHSNTSIITPWTLSNSSNV